MHLFRILLLFGIVCQHCNGVEDTICQKNKFTTIVDHITVNTVEYSTSSNEVTTGSFKEPPRNLNTSFSRLVLPRNFPLADLKKFTSTNNGIDSVNHILNESLPALEHLNFSYNIIREFDDDFLRNLPDLITIDLSFNCLESIDLTTLLQKAYNIRNIHLRGNFLKELIFIPNNPYLYNSFGLNLLDLSHNELSLFQWKGVTVRVLLINNNLIESVSFSEPHQNTKIKVDAQFNKITRYETNVHYHSLNLSHNEIDNLANVDLNHGGKFEHSLDLSYNKINFHKEEMSSKEQHMFEFLGPTVFITDDTHLNLSYNRINSLKFVSEKIRDIGYLSLEGNLLTFVDEHHDLEEIFPRLKYLNLKNNPFEEGVVREIEKNGLTNGQLEINYVPDLVQKLAPRNSKETTIIFITSTDVPVIESNMKHVNTVLIIIALLVVSSIGLLIGLKFFRKSNRVDTESIVKMTVQA